MSTTSLVDPLQEEDDKAPLEKYETLRPRQPRARNSIGLDSPISRLEIRRRLEDHKAFLLEPTVPFDSPPRFLLSPPSIPLPRASTPPRYRDDLFDSFCSSSSSSSHSMDHTPALSRSTSSDSSFSPFHHGSPQFSPWAPPWSNGFETSTSKTHRSKPLQLSSDLESIPWIAPPHDKPLDVSQSAEIGLGFLDFESFLPSSSDRSYHSFNPNEGDYQNQFISFETTNFSGPFLPSSHSAPLPSNHDAPRSYYSQRGEGYDHFQSFQQPSELIRPHALRIPHPYHSSPRPLPPHRNHSLAVDVGRLEQLASTSLSFDFSPDEPSRSHSEPIRVNAPPQAQSSFNDQPQSLTSSSSTRRISANASLEKILNPPVFSPPGDTSSIPFGHPHAF
ncbi:uncharacterized protein JCM6883_004242 [Sporobolomyces salmoneus]|uniref:uncharacterized protein n=1 Tax=Sporobolomyces salmoneus TaxID=183962 RepID=UPI003176071D